MRILFLRSNRCIGLYSVPMYSTDPLEESGGVSFFHFLRDNDSRFYATRGFQTSCATVQFTHYRGSERVLVTALLFERLCYIGGLDDNRGAAYIIEKQQQQLVVTVISLFIVTTHHIIFYLRRFNVLHHI